MLFLSFPMSAYTFLKSSIYHSLAVILNLTDENIFSLTWRRQPKNGERSRGLSSFLSRKPPKGGIKAKELSQAACSIAILGLFRIVVSNVSSLFAAMGIQQAGISPPCEMNEIAEGS